MKITVQSNNGEFGFDCGESESILYAGLRQGLETALGAQLPDVTATVADAMRRKSPRELALIREACASLDAVAIFDYHLGHVDWDVEGHFSPVLHLTRGQFQARGRAPPVVHVQMNIKSKRCKIL